MALMLQVPELQCMDPDNYAKCFRALCWSGIKKEKRSNKKIGKKEKLRRLKAVSALAACYAPALLGNPSHFAVYASVRRTILSRWKHLPGNVSDLSDDSDSEESAQLPITKLPKITGIGLRTVFTLISQARLTDAHFCESALVALLDVLQGHAPEELAQEPTEIITNLHGMLVEIASGIGPGGKVEEPTPLTALSSSCLIALSVARGEAELILNTIASLIMSSSALSEQYIQVPSNLTTLQRSVQSVILGSPTRNQWMNYGVPRQCLLQSCPVHLPPLMTSGPGDLVVRSLVSDGCFLYIFTSKGLLKIGSGYGNTIRQHIYLYKADFFASDRHGWLGYCKNNLYLRLGRKKTEVYEIDKETLEVKHMIRLEPGEPAPVEPKSAVFTDGNQLGLIVLTSLDNLTIRLYDVDVKPDRVEGAATTSLVSEKEINVHLLRRRTLMFGKSPFEDGLSRRAVELDAPVAMQLDDCDEDPLRSIYGGQDFALLTTASGKVYYTGKGSSLGYKASPQTGRWTLMKETIFSRNEAPNVKRCKVIQVAVGHEGVHAILVLDNGTALFTGIARRGEDGDAMKHRRTPKPTRPKKIFKAEGHFVLYAACNYGSTALVTKTGQLLMFGKDTQHCDSAGQVLGLRHERIIQVALGKAHAVALTNFGQVYTFGINNKGQCGREFGYTKEKLFTTRRRSDNKDTRLCTGSHTWTTDDCRVCVLCRECTGFSNACHCSVLPNRVPGEKCGCGEGESGCAVCGVCRRCADAFGAASRPEQATSSASVATADLDNEGEPSVRPESRNELDEEPDNSAQPRSRNDKENTRCPAFEGPGSSAEVERDSSMKVSCLPPAKVAVPGGHRVAAVACGLHHTVLLTENGDVFTFGSNQYGQLGAGDISVHHRIVRVRVPRACEVTAGSNHTAVLTREGELYTFGSYQKGALGRPRQEEPPRSDRTPIWYATPGRVSRLGPRHSCKAVWVSASGDQTFVQVSQALIKTDTLFSSTITANNNTIIILPNRAEHTFKCITINKMDGTCHTWTDSEQVDFVNSLVALDPLYDVLWCYRPSTQLMICFNILAYDSHKVQKCCNDPESCTERGDLEGKSEYPYYGSMKRLEDFKNLENFDLSCSNEDRPTDNDAFSNVSVLGQDLAIPSASGCSVTRMHAALHLLGCLDSLTYAHDIKLNQFECKRESSSSPIVPVKEDFLTVNRFETHGGGWGYSGHSVEAIRFMCDTDILLGGVGLFGGRGDYTGKVKLYDIGMEGGDQEGDGELMAESDEIVFECPPRDRFPIMFDSPISLVANRWYVAWACISGPSSDCGSSGQAMVINDDVSFHFKTSKKSNNGTDVNAGQIPCLLYNTVSPEHSLSLKAVDLGDPIIILSKNLSRKVTVPCFRSLITLLQWSWDSFKTILLQTNGLVAASYKKLVVMKHQKRLVYVIKACLKLVKSYINDIYPQNNRKRNSHEYMSYFDAIADVKNLIQSMMADPTPTCSVFPNKPAKFKKACCVQFAVNHTTSSLKVAHETITACFHAFFPTPTLKWNHLCSLLYNVKNGLVPPSQIRELTSTCAAMCASRSLRDVLQYVVPITQSYMNSNEKRRPESKVINEVPSKSATVPHSSQAQMPPPIPPRASSKDKPKQPDPVDGGQPDHTEWHLLDVISRLLDIVMIPIKKDMMTRQCGPSHDHGEGREHATLSEFCCTLIVRIIAELSSSATDIREDADSNTVKNLMIVSRFMRVNQIRSWNTGNGSPDAICFTVDRPGVMLAGVSVYGGLGNYEYSLELLHDVRLRATADEAHPTNCWVSVEHARGKYCGGDLQHDMVQLKFDRPVPLKEDLRYAIRLCNHGGRTANGDCGLPSVTGPDGTTFRFASCSLSFNGTTLARGQIPCLIYYGSSKTLSNSSESSDSLITALQAITLRVASMVMERSAELFSTLRNELTTEDIKRNSLVLQSSPAIAVLIPYTLANLEGVDDPKSIIKLLEMIHNLLPHVAAMNLLVPSRGEAPVTNSSYYTTVESDHPYKQAAVTNMRVLFPSNVSTMVLEMDPRSITAQPEDSLTVYAVAGTPNHRCHCANEVRVSDPPFRKHLVQLSNDSAVEEIGGESEGDGVCMHYNCSYVSVTPRLANNASDWPQKAIVIPGNEVIFSLETASDYLTDYNKPNNDDIRFGFRCLCVGYEDTPLTTKRQGLSTLEMELVYAGAESASKLLAPDLEIPPLTTSTLVEIQMQAMSGMPNTEEFELPPFGTDRLLSQGLELSCPPSIHQVLDGQPLLRGVTTERQFLMDFIAGAESTAGGRLARWLAPTPRVEPSMCELIAPEPPVLTIKQTLPIVVRDQYGDVVASPALKIEVVAQKLNVDSSRVSTAAAQRLKMLEVPYQTTISDTMSYHAISMMKDYQNYSFEELRLASESWGKGGAVGGTFIQHHDRIPAERLQVRANPDGTYAALWIPRSAGVYSFRCTLDDYPTSQEITIEATKNMLEDPSEREVQTGDSPPSSPPTKLRRFVSRYSAGLRVRSSPSLQAEELGRIPIGTIIGYVEEIVNTDGTWVRLSEDSVRAYADDSTKVAWCLQHHRHLDRVLLVPVESTAPQQSEFSANWSGYGDPQGDMHSWAQDDEDGVLTEITCIGDRNTIFGQLQADASSSMSVGAVEPTRRARIIRGDVSASSSSASSPKRVQRRNNGNSDEWWSPGKQRCGGNGGDDDAVLETDIEPEPSLAEAVSSHLAQIGTQTSPDRSEDSTAMQVYSGMAIKEQQGRISPRSMARERLASRSRAYKRALSPTPQTSRAAPTAAPPPPAPKKKAVSPAQAESLRAVFAALCWHEGIVHDAIACATFLKFHPQLPKQGARVVTRQAHEVTHARHQRHSVEVFNAGHYLSIQPSTLEALTRSGEEACSSRIRNAEMDTPIREEDMPGTSSGAAGPSQSVVNVLPPALRALVAIWDVLYESDHLGSATDKFKNAEKNENEEARPPSGIRKKKEWKLKTGKAPHTVECHLCGIKNLPPPLAFHMRQDHPGCEDPTTKGFDRTGTYMTPDPPPGQKKLPPSQCGELLQSSQLWYMYCLKCYEADIKQEAMLQENHKKLLADIADLESEEEAMRIEIYKKMDHYTMKDNAIFLLDLAPVNNSEPVKMASWNDNTSRGPRTPPGSLWLPAPPFQCLSAFEAEPKAYGSSDAARYHSLGRPPPPAVAPLPSFSGIENNGGSNWPRVHRSVSMGQAGGHDLANAARPPLDRSTPMEEDTLSGAGSSLLAQPSTSLRRLIAYGDLIPGSLSAFEAPVVDSLALLGSSVIAFVLIKRDLHRHRQKMDAAIRINTVRQYAFEAMNWLLRSSTQPTCVHDVMWWFCNALDKFARIVPPPLALDDNKENAAENVRGVIPTASASAICPGGPVARGSRDAFHAFLGSVSALAPSLPPASAEGLQAMRCWAVQYSPQDGSFLHRSQVFSVISKILSHSEDGEGMLGAIQESSHSLPEKVAYGWQCPDVTGWCDISVSSRQGMAGALTDGSTETFWESGDEDRNKAKWIQMTYPGGTPDNRPHILCVHLDNTRDTGNKTLLVSFLYSSGSGEMFHMQDVEVDPKAATWLCYTMPRVASSSVRVRCELRGPEPAVRVRQVRVLGAPMQIRASAMTPTQVLHAQTEADTLRVFRLLTSEVFGQLLDCDCSESGSEVLVTVEKEVPANDSDLREHVVGILFAGHKLTTLQSQVMKNIVCAIGCEAARVKDDWETALLGAEAAAYTAIVQRPSSPPYHQDNFCFEMLSLLLALSGSVVGRSHLAQRTELLPDLLALFHTGSDRVQRQVISLLRRMITEIPPQKMLVAVNSAGDTDTTVTLLDHLVCYLGKAITLQVKVKGASTFSQAAVMMGNSVIQSPPATWFMRGETTKKHAHLIAKLLSDMAEDKVSPAWGLETRQALANYVCRVAHMPEMDRRPTTCVATPTVWVALAALCVCEQSYVELFNGTGESRDSRTAESDGRSYCANHDDGTTAAVIDCRTCGPLCAECDRFLHLNRAARTHHRQICKEEESAVRVDIHEGCGRAKLFWLLLLVDRRTFKALAEFRGMDGGVSGCDNIGGDNLSVLSDATGLTGACRFCGTRGNSGLLAIGNVCADQQCQDHGKQACKRVLNCTHLCGGVRDERDCLPCLFGCAGAPDVAPLRQDADDMCMICFTDPLQAAPAIQLKCGHVFHLHCCKKVLVNKWIGPRITFSFSQCPICKEDISHWTLEELLTPIRQLYDEVKRKALMRLEYEGQALPGGSKDRVLSDPATYAMERYAYYVCHTCGKAYFGGLARCEAETSGSWEPAELICGACSDVTGARNCPKHGADFLEYKCRYCCSVAVFFCFGTSHFCNSCHDDFQRVTNIPKLQLPQCPAGSKGEQLPGTSDDCPLHVQHPPTGEEYALGCGVCRHAQTF